MSENDKFLIVGLACIFLLACVVGLIGTVPTDYWPLGTWPSTLIDHPVEGLPLQCRVSPNHYGEKLYGATVSGIVEDVQWRTQVEPEGGFQGGKSIQVDTFVRYAPPGSAFPLLNGI